MAQALSIGRLAKATGVAARTIRYYESVGVLPPPKRTRAGYRQYEQGSVERLLFVRRARALGLSLADLKSLAATLNGGPRSALRPRLLAVVREHLSAVHRRLAELELLQQQLERVVQQALTSSGPDQAGRCGCLEFEGSRQSHVKAEASPGR
jgi:MerR family transcriptional regulator, copper efflux regulator